MGFEFDGTDLVHKMNDFAPYETGLQQIPIVLTFQKENFYLYKVRAYTVYDHVILWVSFINLDGNRGIKANISPYGSREIQGAYLVLLHKETSSIKDYIRSFFGILEYQRLIVCMN